MSSLTRMSIRYFLAIAAVALGATLASPIFEEPPTDDPYPTTLAGGGLWSG